MSRRRARAFRLQSRGGFSLRQALTTFQASEQGKEDAAQTLSNLAQAPFPAQTHLPVQQHPYPGLQQPGGVPGINDPGPSSHPRGPPNLGQLSTVAVAAPPAPGPRPAQPQAQEVEEGDSGAARSVSVGKDATPSLSSGATTTRRGGRSATMGSDEWTRQRKDNHASSFQFSLALTLTSCSNNRKKLSADAEAISMKGLMNSDG